MSKSGSRYGRRSNWFKIHCLLQEQQQQAAAAAAAGNRKTPPPSNSLNMLGHSSYPQGMYPRPPCTKEELMLLGFEDYTSHNNNKHPSASPSVSSPDSHNSDSSVEVGDRRQSLLRQSQAQQNRNQLPPPPFNKELFLPLSFPGLMPPPGFLPPSHLMFPGYHPALYAQHQGLLKPAIDPTALINSSHAMMNNNNRFIPNNNNSKSAEELTKRYLDAVLKSQRSPSAATIKSEEDDDMDSEDIVVSMTPPSSPPIRHTNNISRNSSSTATTTLREKQLNITIKAPSSPPRIISENIAQRTPSSSSSSSSLSSTSSTHIMQDIPIDLSMKTGSCTSGDDQRTFTGTDDGGDLSDADELNDAKRPRSNGSCERASNHNNENGMIESDVLRIKALGTKPLDLTTKV